MGARTAECFLKIRLLAPRNTFPAHDCQAGSGRCLPRGVAQGRYCLAQDEYDSIETVSRDGKSMFGAQEAR